jgi:hypothetical protein
MRQVGVVLEAAVRRHQLMAQALAQVLQVEKTALLLSLTQQAR